MREPNGKGSHLRVHAQLPRAVDGVVAVGTVVLDVVQGCHKQRGKGPRRITREVLLVVQHKRPAVDALP